MWRTSCVGLITHSPSCKERRVFLDTDRIHYASTLYEAFTNMPPKRRSPSSTPVPSTEGAQGDGSQLPEAEWKAMQDILSTIYNYRTAEYVQLTYSYDLSNEEVR